jgi:hypothetical protein
MMHGRIATNELAMKILPLTVLLGFVLLGAPSSVRSIEFEGAGVVLGGSYMEETYEDPLDYYLSSRGAAIPGLVAGLYSRVYLGARFAIGLEAMYVRKGFSREALHVVPLSGTDSRFDDGTNVYSAHYLSLPVNIRFQFGTGAARPVLFAGIGTEVLLGRGDSGYFDEFDPVDFSAQFGMGFMLKRFELNVRYVRDITGSPVTEFYSGSVINSGIIAVVTYAIVE